LNYSTIARGLFTAETLTHASFHVNAIEFLFFACQTQDFAEFCLECLGEPWQRRADEAFERYRETMPMKEIVEKLLDTTVGPLFSAGRCSGFQTVDDEVRDKPIFGAAKEFHLIGEEQGYNIVRRGPEIYAID